MPRPLVPLVPAPKAQRRGDLADLSRPIALLVLLTLVGATAVRAAPPGKPASSSGTGIYTCTDERGRRLTADRPIPECTAKEQQVLNKDGSLKRVHPPTMTAEERAAHDARERRLAAQRASAAEVVRRDRNLMSRYADEAAHERAREAALDTVRLAIRTSETRLRDLGIERKPLLAEAEFYPGRPLPPKLKTALDANDALTAAQRQATANQEAELDRINRYYDAELERLRRLWAGAAPGSLGPITAPTSAAKTVAGPAPAANPPR
jgi:hypothetical protein